MSASPLDRSMAEYLANIEARDARQESQKRFTDDFNKVVTRATRAEAKLRAIEISGVSGGRDNTSSDILTHLRSELATARADLATAKTTQTTSTAQITDLQAKLTTVQQALASSKQESEFFKKQAAALDRKVKDRHSESRESRKLIDDVQNEMIMLQLQLNLAEERADKLEKDNAELVERWMAKMRKEAESMNEESKW